MLITEKINTIIDRRIGRNGFEGKGHLEAIRMKKTFFQELKIALVEYQALRSNILSQIENKQGEYYNMSLEDPSLQQKVELADPSASLLQLEKCQAECDRLVKRFNRETINISVVGRARQGKSRLLQSISGLPNDIIPADDGGDCTGAKSIITNSDEANTRASVSFYSESEILNAVNDYLSALGWPTIGSVNQIQHVNIQSIEDSITTGTDKSSWLDHLRKYVDHYDSYGSLLGRTIDVSSPNDIRRYTSQYLDDGTKTYEYLGVKEVKIYTRFNYADAGKIQLVDTIGLFDTALGLEHKMMNTLVDDSDAAILLRLPNPQGDHVDVNDNKLYNDIESCMGQQALDKWLFYVLNVWSDNQNSGAYMYEQLSRQFGKTLKVAFLKQVDCANQNRVENEIVIPILETLANNLVDIDNSLMAKANLLFFECFQKYFDLCGKVNQVVSGGFRKSLQSGGLFDLLYDGLRLPRELNGLVRKYNDAKECMVISDNIRSIIRNIASYCPSVEEISDRLMAGGAIAYSSTVYFYFADNLRAKIRDEFEKINTSTIATLQDDFKREVCGILAKDGGGRLKRIPLQMDGDEDLVSWLQTLTEQKLDNFPLVAEAFTDIIEYQLNIEGSLEFKIDEALNRLDPANANFIIPDFQGLSVDEIARVIEQTLNSTIPDIARDIIKGIQELLLVPYHSFRARIRKLYDRIIMKEEGKRELKNLYREHAIAIWPDDFNNLVKNQTVLGNLNTCVSNLNEKREKGLFTLKI